MIYYIQIVHPKSSPPNAKTEACMHPLIRRAGGARALIHKSRPARTVWFGDDLLQAECDAIVETGNGHEASLTFNNCVQNYSLLI